MSHTHWAFDEAFNPQLICYIFVLHFASFVNSALGSVLGHVIIVLSLELEGDMFERDVHDVPLKKQNKFV